MSKGSLSITVPSDVVKYVEEQQINLTIIGPEAPLAAGVPDALRQNDHLVFVPTNSRRSGNVEGELQKFMHRWDLFQQRVGPLPTCSQLY